MMRRRTILLKPLFTFQSLTSPYSSYYCKNYDKFHFSFFALCTTQFASMFVSAKKKIASWFSAGEKQWYVSNGTLKNHSKFFWDDFTLVNLTMMKNASFTFRGRVPPQGCKQGAPNRYGGLISDINVSYPPLMTQPPANNLGSQHMF